MSSVTNQSEHSWPLLATVKTAADAVAGAGPDRTPALDLSPEAGAFVRAWIDVDSAETRIVHDTIVVPWSGSPAEAVVGSARLNDILHINGFLRRANRLLREGGLLTLRVRTLEDHLQEVRRSYTWSFLYFARYVIEFLAKRVAPRTPNLKRVYFSMTNGHNRLISETEALGRIVYCGFDIVATTVVDGMLHVIARKSARPPRNRKPSYGLLCRLSRTGKGGRRISVYKFRTMHPYAEFLQAYVYEQNRLADGGKFRDDFRVTEWGRLLRRFWLDELPMVLNWLNGDLKLVGPRPLSQQYASLYPKAAWKYRSRFKPGLVPPFYADLPGTFDEIVESEQRYLRAYERTPLTTDCRYLIRAFANILFRNARSQ